MSLPAPSIIGAPGINTAEALNALMTTLRRITTSNGYAVTVGQVGITHRSSNEVDTVRGVQLYGRPLSLRNTQAGQGARSIETRLQVELQIVNPIGGDDGTLIGGLLVVYDAIIDQLMNTNPSLRTETSDPYGHVILASVDSLVFGGDGEADGHDKGLAVAYCGVTLLYERRYSTEYAQAVPVS